MLAKDPHEDAALYGRGVTQLRYGDRAKGQQELTTFAARIREVYAETTLPTYVDRQLRALESLNEQIADADRELATTAKADPIARRLMTVPGVGPSTSVRFVAALAVVVDGPVEIGLGFLDCMLALRPILGVCYRHRNKPRKRHNHNCCYCCLANSMNHVYSLLFYGFPPVYSLT